jgi:hypothetical protein
MRKKFVLVVLAAAALAVSPALAAKKKDTYNLKGDLSAYTAAVDSTPGSITILVTKANHAGQALVGQTLTFSLDATTKVQLEGGAIVDGDHGTLQVKGAPGLDATGVQALTPKLVVDQTGGS